VFIVADSERSRAQSKSPIDHYRLIFTNSADTHSPLPDPRPQGLEGIAPSRRGGEGWEMVGKFSFGTTCVIYYVMLNNLIDALTAAGSTNERTRERANESSAHGRSCIRSLSRMRRRSVVIASVHPVISPRRLKQPRQTSSFLRQQLRIHGDWMRHFYRSYHAINSTVMPDMDFPLSSAMTF